MASSTLRANIEATFRKCISRYAEAAVTKDPSVINLDLVPECTRHLHPVSLLTDLGAPADWTIDNAEYERETADDLKHGGVTKWSLSNLVIDTETRKAAALTCVDMTFNDGEVLVMEHSWVMEFNEDGTKVTKIVEFCDSDSVKKLMAKKAGNAK